MQLFENEVFCQKIIPKNKKSCKRDRKNWIFFVGGCNQICVYGLQFEKFFGIMSPIKSKSALGCIGNNIGQIEK
jgi:hypothetical protein